MVIAAAMGMCGSGNRIYVDGASFGPELVVDVVSESLAANCARTLDMRQPVDIVLVPQTDRPVHFIEQAKTFDCPN
jgi:hypothetical protein